MGEFSLTHILVMAVVLLLFVGPKKLPELGKSLGKGIRDFKKSLNEVDPTQTPPSTPQISQTHVDQDPAQQDLFEKSDKKNNS